MDRKGDALHDAIRRLLLCLACVGVAYGAYRWGRSMPGELGFAGMIFVVPIYLAAGCAIYLAVLALWAFLRYLAAPPDASSDDRPVKRVPDADAVEALRAHGALPPEPPRGAGKAKRKDLAIGAVALGAGALLWATDPIAAVREFAVALVVFGVIQLVFVSWRAARDGRR